ncbi:lanthionine synthetase C family protein [Luteipulveratus mongoliensis]|uniref:Lanthionine synthetase C family protein n=1 Tax=Luteipulveratus mongoliensis TaxID=571913 RepID=A0A0K1JPE0_9MICO|nr:lanthionine synthetase C family protein [Luteipulveratus mongoliensis]
MTESESLARAGLDWMISSGVPVPGGVGWRSTPEDDDEIDPTLYSGGAGVVLALLEGQQHFNDDRLGEAALSGAAGLASAVDDWEHCGLYFGKTGVAFALNAVGDLLGDDAAQRKARTILDDVRRAFDGERWNVQIELLGGNAGIALGALALGDIELAVLAVEPYLRLAETTAHGVTWEGKTGLVARFHHISHGTLGIVSALAAVAKASGRGDLLDLALAGAADVVAREESGPSGFLVPHSDPQHRPELIERYSYGWCHGPAGDAQTFRLLHQVTGDQAWTGLVDRCWTTVTISGLPERRRPGFWDNNGRCCGTAGVLALSSDLTVENPDLAARNFADVLVDDLRQRATVDADGARWSNVEHRVEPSSLVPQPGWAMGNAGIVRELLRYVRLDSEQQAAYAVAWPDQPTSPTRADGGQREAHHVDGDASS